MTPQPTPEAVQVVDAALRANAVLTLARFQGIDTTTEQQTADATLEALFAYLLPKSYDDRRDWYTDGQYSADCAPEAA